MNKPVKSPLVLKMHPEMGDLADQQMDADREWFINHQDSHQILPPAL